MYSGYRSVAGQVKPGDDIERLHDPGRKQNNPGNLPDIFLLSDKKDKVRRTGRKGNPDCRLEDQKARFVNHRPLLLEAAATLFLSLSVHIRQLIEQLLKVYRFRQNFQELAAYILPLVLFHQVQQRQRQYLVK